MSERMIELQRARLLAANGGAAAIPNGAAAGGSVTTGAATRNQPQQTPTEVAMARMSAIDQRTRCFLDRIRTERDDSQPTTSETNTESHIGSSSAAGNSNNGPTVPTALSRRMLHRRGVGYRDSAVAALTSAAADRFIATVLQQAITCRDQRLKGSQMAKQTAKQRQRHKRQYQEDADDRIRRKETLQHKHDEYHVSCLEASDLVRQKIAAKATAADAKVSPKKKKKSDNVLNGVKRHAKPPPLEGTVIDAHAYDSLDEDEAYYRNHYGDHSDPDSASDSEDDDDDMMMILEDVKRPLLAYDFHLEGKLGLSRIRHRPDASDKATEDDDNLLNANGMLVQQQQSTAMNGAANGNDDGDAAMDVDGDGGGTTT